MCGIFGVFGPRRPAFSLIELNRARGDLGCGCVELNWDRSFLRVMKSTDLGPLPATTVADVTLYHVRAPTGGQTDDIERLHPVECEDFFLAHNGLLLGNPVPDQSRMFPNTDTGALAQSIHDGLLAGFRVEESIAVAAQELPGQQACWLVDKRDWVLYVWRVMSPIWIGGNWFSSVRVYDAAGLLDEGVVYRYAPDPGRFVGTSRFKFETPYVVE